MNVCARRFVPGKRKVQQVRLCETRVMYGSDSGFVGLASVVDGRDLFRMQAHSALVTALDYDAATGWALSAADDGLVHVYRETPEVGGWVSKQAGLGMGMVRRRGMDGPQLMHARTHARLALPDLA
jgi:hypothetical protein